MESDLAKQECVPCKVGAPPLKGENLLALLNELGHDWQMVNGHHLEKEFSFEDFRTALEFTNRVGQIAEAQNHHPEIHLAWGKVKVLIWTHKAGGLTQNDFVLAAKVERAYPS